jgi:hypothetical protein
MYSENKYQLSIVRTKHFKGYLEYIILDDVIICKRNTRTKDRREPVIIHDKRQQK